ncbi:protein SOSEKI 2-like [Prosopis cineraria]|uniref:protein SOSEKI 2-like n=1 Tax=Prosopis cineraria TaxID=364024 RepID=UPI00240F0B41|nr:protein SOSEKI 2-like [Prosopis cineraria]
MDVAGSRRSSRDTSPDRVKICRLNHNNNVRPLKKVQVVYYLSRSGLLEHPHYLEITLSANEPLRLKDVLDRLVAMRGSGMPTLYSWSCKRSYKRGYVWYDLAANDIIYPSEGAEYVLKGSEIVEDCSERVQQTRLSKRSQAAYQDPAFNTSRKSFHSSLHREAEDFQEYEEQEEYYEDGEKTSNTSSTTTPHSRCSRGVSTGELEEDHEPKPHSQIKTVKVTVNHAPPPSPSPATSTLADKLQQKVKIKETNNSSKRFEDGLEPSRSSILLQLIACGSSAVSKAKNAPCMSNGVKKREGNSEISVRKREAVKVSEEEMIKCMSENPRFGNLQSEEKEYFSGSLVESRKENRVHSEAVLKKSNSYNEERSSKAGIGEEEEDKEEEKEKGGSKGKCIPLSNKKSVRK